jgi:hypothetical protein
MMVRLYRVFARATMGFGISPGFCAKQQHQAVQAGDPDLRDIGATHQYVHLICARALFWPVFPGAGCARQIQMAWPKSCVQDMYLPELEASAAMQELPHFFHSKTPLDAQPFPQLNLALAPAHLPVAVIGTPFLNGRWVL